MINTIKLNDRSTNTSFTTDDPKNSVTSTKNDSKNDNSPVNAKAMSMSIIMTTEFISISLQKEIYMI